MRAKRAHEKRLKRFSHSGCRCTPFSVHDLAEQIGHSLVGKRPTGAFSDSTRFPLEGERKQGMDNLRFSSIAKRYATGISFTVRSKIAYRRSPRVRTPAAYLKAPSRPFATPFFRSPFMAWPNKSATALRENAPPGHFLVPQGPLEGERKVPLKRNRKPKDGQPTVCLHR